jgi:hypothetical protein
MRGCPAVPSQKDSPRSTPNAVCPPVNCCLSNGYGVVEDPRHPGVLIHSTNEDTCAALKESKPVSSWPEAA